MKDAEAALQLPPNQVLALFNKVSGNPQPDAPSYAAHIKPTIAYQCHETCEFTLRP